MTAIEIAKRDLADHASGRYVRDAGVIARARQIVGISASQEAAPAQQLDRGAAAVVIPDSPILLGLDASGRPVTLADVETKGLALWHSIVKHSDVGAEVSAMMREVTLEPLLAKAAALKINVEQLTAAAIAAKMDPAAALAAEIQNQEVLARDKARHGTTVQYA
jgi:post-segregation antitoxin (ccd killing protein)